MKRYFAVGGVGVFMLCGVCLAVSAACSSSSSKGSSAGSDAGDMADTVCEPIDSACGQPCQAGNSLGIGRFCNHISDCQGTKLPTLCATLGAPNEHFCTAMCSPADAGDEAGFPQNCGENATCQCQGTQCGCFPTACK
jgi:hypothetical protein